MKKDAWIRIELLDCPVATTVSLIGSNWNLLIIRNLLARPWRFNELSELGKSLRPVLDAMMDWGNAYKGAV